MQKLKYSLSKFLTIRILLLFIITYLWAFSLRLATIAAGVPDLTSTVLSIGWLQIPQTFMFLILPLIVFTIYITIKNNYSLYTLLRYQQPHKYLWVLYKGFIIDFGIYLTTIVLALGVAGLGLRFGTSWQPRSSSGDLQQLFPTTLALLGTIILATLITSTLLFIFYFYLQVITNNLTHLMYALIVLLLYSIVLNRFDANVPSLISPVTYTHFANLSGKLHLLGWLVGIVTLFAVNIEAGFNYRKNMFRLILPAGGLALVLYFANLTKHTGITAFFRLVFGGVNGTNLLTVPSLAVYLLFNLPLVLWLFSRLNSTSQNTYVLMRIRNFSQYLGKNLVKLWTFALIYWLLIILLVGFIGTSVVPSYVATIALGKTLLLFGLSGAVQAILYTLIIRIISNVTRSYLNGLFVFWLILAVPLIIHPKALNYFAYMNSFDQISHISFPVIAVKLLVITGVVITYLLLERRKDLA
ncbi:hypothetical protein EQG49_05585 [Periweissella cryptocerci]|uniref:Uncharacterized protein n=1 Tax=Periweissella cryptocerci TaxID=2506420 RepID=A0A4P6YTI6_9LACO|nr:hypothetical protein [Periweissella cryptocerci]QBO35967.1 hypothetical protein EQG49_05585 [Periweissella cryptocerci]